MIFTPNNYVSSGIKLLYIHLTTTATVSQDVTSRGMLIIFPAEIYTELSRQNTYPCDTVPTTVPYTSPIPLNTVKTYQKVILGYFGFLLNLKKNHFGDVMHTSQIQFPHMAICLSLVVVISSL